MAKLLDTLARKERETFFARLDLEWGRGFQYRTKSDRCPNVFEVTAPRRDVETHRVMLYGDYGTSEQIWQTEWRELAEAYAETCRAEGFKVRVVARQMPVLSRNQAAHIENLVTAFRLGCQNQTVVKRAWEVKKPRVYRSTRLLPKSNLTEPDFSGFATLVPAPYRIVDGKKEWLP